MSNQPPIEVPQGAIRLNTDSQRLEFFAQDRWYEMATEDASDSGSRAFRVAGDNPSNGTIIDIFNITTGGQAYDSGFDLSQGTGQMACAGSRTRAIIAGGFTGNPNFGAKQFIQYFEMAALSNSIDFGDLTHNKAGRNAGHSNNTRMVVTGSTDIQNVNIIDLITISTTGNASDFGDTLQPFASLASAGSRTRALFGGGSSPTDPYPTVNSVEFVTIASTGNSIDFGDLTVARYSLGAVSNSTRSVFMMGNINPVSNAQTNVIDFFNTATTGNAQDFGDVDGQELSQMPFTASNATRGVFGGGYKSSSPNTTSEIGVINIHTRGNSTKFGDLSGPAASMGSGCCDGHGGIQ